MDTAGDSTSARSTSATTSTTTGETAPIKTNAVPELQEFVITPDGTLTIAKAGHCVSRGTNTQTRIWRDVR